MSAIDDLVDTIERLDTVLRVAETDSDVTASQLASLFRAKVDACDRLAKLRGEGELTATSMMKSKVWLDFMAKLQPVLERHPKFAQDFVALVESLEAG